MLNDVEELQVVWAVLSFKIIFDPLLRRLKLGMSPQNSRKFVNEKRPNSCCGRSLKNIFNVSFENRSLLVFFNDKANHQMEFVHSEFFDSNEVNDEVCDMLLFCNLIPVCFYVVVPGVLRVQVIQKLSMIKVFKGS